MMTETYPLYFSGSNTKSFSDGSVEDVHDATEVPDTSSDRRIKVLFADDDPDTLDLLGLAARRIGNFDFRLASDGAQVAHFLETEQFDVLCLDAQMPIAYGTTIARMVRDRDISMPIIFFTGRSGREVRLATEEVGATLVTKPASPGHLMTMIAKLASERISYHGPDRRVLSVNLSEQRRRATDQPFELPESLCFAAKKHRRP
jgi:DNA-binding response OmpR family regulator